jgi:prepilin-type N-terminal cleavage/methylation domain-containing protein
MNTKRKGFSLIELIVVIAVLSVIVTIIVPSISGAQEAATRQKAIAAAESLNLAQIRYRMENGSSSWPSGQEARYTALTPYLDFAPTTLAQFGSQVGTDYSFTINNLGVKVTINLPGGGTLAQGDY